MSAPDPVSLGPSSGSATGIPPVRITPSVRTHIVADEAVLAAFRVLRRPPSDTAWQQMLDESQRAQRFYTDAGWLDDPRSFHADPPPLARPELRRTRIGRLPVERIAFPSSWSPPAGAPGRERWLSYRANRTARATVVRHSDGPRPWIVCVHGTAMGRDSDVWSFRARHLFTDLGCNVVLPILPLHGPRRAPRSADAQFPSIDPVDNVSGLAQAAHDVRQIIGWVRSQSPAAIGLQGVSLGGYVAALVAGLEPALDCVVAIIPVSDFPELFRSQTPPEMSARLEPMREPMAALHRAVSPLCFLPQTAPHDRFIAAGLVDRLVDPAGQVAPLWRHWQQPSIHWYPGGHVGYAVRRDVRWFVDAAFIRSGVVRIGT